MRSVLVVDDYADARELLETVLTKAGYVALTAADGSEGLRVARAARPDAIVMDIFMPVMDGIRATELLKADPATANIPVMAYTAQPQPMDNSARLFAAICVKPCAPGVLLAMLRRMLEPAS